MTLENWSIFESFYFLSKPFNVERIIKNEIIKENEVIEEGKKCPHLAFPFLYSFHEQGMLTLRSCFGNSIWIRC